jgi:hypothetical protein
LESIASQYRSGFIKLDMTSRAATPQIIVVHGWQIIVDQGVRMDHFEGSCIGQSG